MAADQQAFHHDIFTPSEEGEQALAAVGSGVDVHRHVIADGEPVDMNLLSQGVLSRDLAGEGNLGIAITFCMYRSQVSIQVMEEVPSMPAPKPWPFRP